MQPNQVPVGGTRLSRKTRPGLTPYAHLCPTGHKVEQAKRKRQNQDIRATNARNKHKQIAIATNTIVNNIGFVTEMVARESAATESEDVYDWNFARQIHSTHSIQAIKPSSEAFFCVKCGYYNDGGRLRQLRKPCPGPSASERAQAHVQQPGSEIWK